MREVMLKHCLLPASPAWWKSWGRFKPTNCTMQTPNGIHYEVAFPKQQWKIEEKFPEGNCPLTPT